MWPLDSSFGKIQTNYFQPMKTLLFAAVLWLLSVSTSAQHPIADSIVKAFQSKATWSEKSDVNTTISMKKLRTVIIQKDKKNYATIKRVIRARSGITKVYYDNRQNHIDAVYLDGKLYRIFWTEWEYKDDGASKIIKSTTWVAGNMLSIKYHQTGKNTVINLLE